jgi:uncharacterized protein
MIEFEFDPEKSRRNKEKHAIDFIEGQELWKDIDLLEIKAKTIDEERYIEIGKIGIKHWTAVITYRDNKIRIISIRASRQTEKELYESD